MISYESVDGMGRVWRDPTECESWSGWGPYGFVGPFSSKTECEKVLRYHFETFKKFLLSVTKVYPEVEDSDDGYSLWKLDTGEVGGPLFTIYGPEGPLHGWKFDTYENMMEDLLAHKALGPSLRRNNP